MATRNRQQPTPSMLKQRRLATGESLRTTAGRIGIDASTLFDWEARDTLGELQSFKTTAWIKAVKQAENDKGKRDANGRRCSSDGGAALVRSS